MKKFLFTVVCILCGATVVVASESLVDKSPMVKNHIFGQRKTTDINKSDKVVKNSNLYKYFERKANFTGILDINGSRRALLKTKSHRKEDGLSSCLAVGETILEMKLIEIGKNYIVLSKKGEELRLNLFKNRKDRPSVPKSLKPSNIPAINTLRNSLASDLTKKSAVNTGGKTGKSDKSTANTKKLKPNSQNNAASNPNANPFLKAIQKARTTPATKGPNPFLESIRKAKESQQK